MTKNTGLFAIILLLSACGSSNPTEIDSITGSPSRSDIVKVCGVEFAQNAAQIDKQTQSGMENLEKDGTISEEDLGRMRDVNAGSLDSYREGMETCCDKLSESISDLNEKQRMIVYADMLSMVDDLTPAEERQLSDWRFEAKDNIPPSESRVVANIPSDYRRCEGNLKAEIATAHQTQMNDILREYGLDNSAQRSQLDRIKRLNDIRRRPVYVP
ncbi:MAG: hypothetical protein AAGH53_04865 [Pseudomonadota bacterium]